MNSSEIENILNNFILDEDKALESQSQGKWYIMNWPTLDKVLKKAPSVLSEAQLLRLYFHLIRLGKIQTKELGQTYALWEQAYREYIKLDQSFFDVRGHLAGLVLFGFDKKQSIGVNQNYEDYSIYTNAISQIRKYSHVSGMLSKPEKFIFLASNEKIVNRFCASIQYQLDHYTAEIDCSSANMHLLFWGIIYTLLLSEYPVAAKTIAHFKAAKNLPEREGLMQVLDKFELTSQQFFALRK